MAELANFKMGWDLHRILSSPLRGATSTSIAIGLFLFGVGTNTVKSAQVVTIEATDVEIEAVDVVASHALGSTLIAAHAALIEESLGVDIGHALAVFTLTRSVFEEGANSTGCGEFGSLAWTTHSICEHDWSAFPDYEIVATSLGDKCVRGAVVVGVLKGSAASVPSVALGFEFEESQGGSSSFLIPLAKVNADPAILSALVAPQAAAPLLGWPCIGAASGGTPCEDRSSTLKNDALRAFNQCMKSNAAPLGWAAALCVIVCPLSGPALPACVAACLALGGSILIDYSACSEELTGANCNAAQVYCTCIQYQQAFCPQVAEPDTIGCPNGPSGAIPGCD